MFESLSPYFSLAAIHAASYFPPAISLPAGQFGGWVSNQLDLSRRRVGATNLALCFPKLSQAERDALLKTNLAETGKTITETPYFWHRADEATLRAAVQAEPAKSRLDAAYQQGKGVIVAAPHLGAWEILGLWLSLEYGITSLYRPQDGVLEASIKSARERFGAKLVPTTAGGVRTLLGALRKNQMIGILPDQDPPRESGTMAPFFGVPAHTTTLLPKLAQRSQAPVFVVWLQRHDDHYQLHCEPVADDIYASDVTVATTAMNAAIERCVEHCPEQYWWTYPRFRRLAKGKRQY